MEVDKKIDVISTRSRVFSGLVTHGDGGPDGRMRRLCASALARPALMPVTARRRAFARMVDNDQGVEYPVKKSEEEWRHELAPETFYILREKGTERPGTGKKEELRARCGTQDQQDGDSEGGRGGDGSGSTTSRTCSSSIRWAS